MARSKSGLPLWVIIWFICLVIAIVIWRYYINLGFLGLGYWGALIIGAIYVMYRISLRSKTT